MSRHRASILLFALSMLAACFGGGSSGGTTGTPVVGPTPALLLALRLPR